jgi:hypothetical protein
MGWSAALSEPTGGINAHGGNIQLVDPQDAIRNWMPTYGLVFKSVLSESIPIQNSKNRVLDPAYRTRVAQELNAAYERFGVIGRSMSLANADSEIEFALQFVETSLAGSNS